MPVGDLFHSNRYHQGLGGTILMSGSKSVERLGKHIAKHPVREEELRVFAESRFSKQSNATILQEKCKEQSMKIKAGGARSKIPPSVEAQVSQRMKERVEQLGLHVTEGGRDQYVTTAQRAYC